MYNACLSDVYQADVTCRVMLSDSKIIKCEIKYADMVMSDQCSRWFHL